MVIRLILSTYPWRASVEYKYTYSLNFQNNKHYHEQIY